MLKGIQRKFKSKPNTLSPQLARKRLKYTTAIFFLVLLLPLLISFFWAAGQLRLNTYVQYVWNAEQIIWQAEHQIEALLLTEKERPVTDYLFFKTATNTITNEEIRELSPISRLPDEGLQSGMVGYFQIDGSGQFSSPVLPIKDSENVLGIDLAEWQKRSQLVTMLEEIVAGSKISAWQNIDNRFGFLASRLADGFIVFYRKINSSSRPMVQGFVFDENIFFDQQVSPFFQQTNFISAVKLSLISSSESVADFYNLPDDGKWIGDEGVSSIHKGRFMVPLQDIGFAFYAYEFPAGPALVLLQMSLVAVIIIMLSGLWVLYRFGEKQIQLAQDRLNFVSAVSHELKTPLTSILMYSEMLRQGMPEDEAKKKQYFDYIFFESERLSRLISNVLRLSSLSQEDVPLDPQYTLATVLPGLVKSKISSLLEKNGFEYQLDYEELDPDRVEVCVDLDAFSQIVINLADNAVKFAAGDKDVRKIEMGLRQEDAYPEHICFYLRDHGPGIAESQIEKIFDLFYRVGDELNRRKQGTGIGLALVHALSNAMGGFIRVINRNPGAEFCLYLKCRKVEFS